MSATKRSKPNVQPIARPPEDILLQKGLPVNLDAERFVLGSLLLDDSLFGEATELAPDDFLPERHRQIFACMRDLRSDNESVDRVTVASELARRGQLGHDGISYLSSLDDGLPHLPHIDSYIAIVRDKSTLRRLIYAGQKLVNECVLETMRPTEIFDSHLATVQELHLKGRRNRQCIENIPRVGDLAGRELRFLHEPLLVAGSVVALTGDAGSGKSTFALWLAGQVSAGGTPVLILDRENPIAVVSERLDRAGITDGPMLRYCGGWIEGGVPGPGDAAVVDWVKRCNPRPLVVVDSVRAFHGGDENDSALMRAFLQQSRGLADVGATVLLTHHTGKSDTAQDFRGSSDFKASIDAGYCQSNYGAAGRLGLVRLRCFKSRFGFAGEIVYHYSDGQFVQDQDPDSPSTTMAKQLGSILRANPGIGAREFDHLALKEGVSRASARNWLNDGVLSGDIERKQGSQNRWRYSLIRGEN